MLMLNKHSTHKKGEKNENATAETEHRQVLNRLIYNYCSAEHCETRCHAQKANN